MRVKSSTFIRPCLYLMHFFLCSILKHGGWGSCRFANEARTHGAWKSSGTYFLINYCSCAFGSNIWYPENHKSCKGVTSGSLKVVATENQNFNLLKDGSDLIWVRIGQVNDLKYAWDPFNLKNNSYIKVFLLFIADFRGYKNDTL